MGFRVHHGEQQRVVTGPWKAAGDELPNSHMARLLQQLHAELRGGLVDVDGTLADHALELDSAEFELASDRWEKECVWQHDVGRDLYCTAVHRDAATAAVIHELGDQAGYETDLSTCHACEIPDERLLCAAFSHAKVYPDITMGPGKYGHPKEILSASCRLGHDIIVESPEDCRPGGHKCWHQTVVEERWSPLPTDGLHLLEAFDFLDSEWRHRHSGKPLVVPTSIAEAAQLIKPVLTRADFRDQVVRVGELLQKLKVEGTLFDTKAASGAVERLRQWCEQHAPGGVGPVDRLAEINTLRNALSHPDPPKLAAALESINISYPPDSWAEAWQGVMAHVDTALRDLRREITSAG